MTPRPAPTLEVGKKYYRKRSLCGAVRQVLAIASDKVTYQVLHGPARERTPQNTCSLRRFQQWADGEFVGDNYAQLDGAQLHKTFVVRNVAGQPLFRCGSRRGQFYLRKGFAQQIDVDTLQLLDLTTEQKLRELYGEQLSPFFMAVKNDRCVVCGTNQNLTRHHVVPRRYKRQLPPETRQQLSNILFVCMECHRIYETQALVSDVTNPLVWRDHFIATMQPQFLPLGWDIFLTKPQPDGSQN